ncbi:MAG: alpha/beta fold hydrolase [Solirubrobacteraceae bacterium]
MPHRRTVNVDGVELSVVANRPGTPRRLLLLHGTFWSRVWTPIMAALGDSLVVAALDFPGFGRSGGELDDRDASVPDLADLALRTADVLGAREFTVAGHDIGGAVAQHLAVHASERVRQLVLVNSVLYDSWPVPAVARFRDPETRMATTPQEFRDGRRLALARATTRDLGEDATAEYLSPWQDEPRIRSWMAMAAAADARYTLDLLPALREQAPSTLVLWGADDEFQPVSYAERFAAEVPSAQLVTVVGARHIPMEDDPERVAGELLAFLELVTITEVAG